MTTIPPYDTFGPLLETTEGNRCPAQRGRTGRRGKQIGSPSEATSWHELTTIIGDRVIAGAGNVAPRDASAADTRGIREQGEDPLMQSSANWKRANAAGASNLMLRTLVESQTREVRFVARRSGTSVLPLSCDGA